MASTSEQPVSSDDDLDDEMAELFSFGIGDADVSAAAGTNAVSSTTPNNDDSTSHQYDLSSNKGETQQRDGSPDSFLEMLNAETNAVVLDGITTNSSGESSTNNHTTKHDKETQDILDWLDKDDSGEAEIVFHSTIEPPKPIVIEEKKEPEPTVVTLPPSYETFQEALESNESTVEQIRTLFVKEQSESEQSILKDTKQRSELYSRMICHKALHDTISSSLADSFDQWRKTRLSVIEEVDEPYVTWIKQQNLARRIADATNRPLQECENDMIELVLYQHHQKKEAASMTTGNNNNNNENTDSSSSYNQTEEKDILLPAVAATILSAGIPVLGASVMLAHIIPNFMPLLALPPETERWEAAMKLHTEFYLLACYHLPLLVIHLDKFLPGWYWPKLPEEIHQEEKETQSAVQVGRTLTKRGQIPPSWLLSHLAGECDGGIMLPIDMVIKLWDTVLTSNNNAARFFLTLAVLERKACSLLLLTGDELLIALQKTWTLENIDDDKDERGDDKDWEHEWLPKAQGLQDATPDSVLERLKHVEDDAVQQALIMRQQRTEAALQARLEAEAEAHREAQEKKADEARLRLSRARLVAFYRKHAPDKESNIDKIMETYGDRLEILDTKLRTKYGEGFNPAIKPKPPKPPTNNLLATMNQGLNRIKVDGKENNGKDEVEDRKPDKVSVTVTAEEVLPIVCWTKEAAATRGHNGRRRRQKDRKQLKFYLVDSRSEEAAAEQGKFPTAVNLSPETMLDPEKLQQTEAMFESFRGAVHIVIMGEGFNALPKLYDQKLSPKLQALMERDESRVNLCALFFQKRGFCFVSVLEGGFCAAHSWLAREGPKQHLSPSAVLIDYNPEASLFGQMETLQNASATEKAQRKMANLLESSLVSMTKRAQQLERIAADLDKGEGGRQGLRMALFGRGESNAESMDSSKRSSTDESTEGRPAFKNPFANLAAKRDEKDSGDQEAISDLNAAVAEGTSDKSTTAPSNNETPEQQAAAAANPFGKFLQNTGGVQNEQTGANRFKGLGAALKQANTAGQKRWARLSSQPEANRAFGGFNQFRKNTMSRIRRGVEGEFSEELSGPNNNESTNDVQVKKV